MTRPEEVIAVVAGWVERRFADITQGPKGDKGDAGRDGADGKPGAMGLRGPEGKRGEKGADGADGKDGADGQDGAKGERGLPGQAGASAPGAVPQRVRVIATGIDAKVREIEFDGATGTLEGARAVLTGFGGGSGVVSSVTVDLSAADIATLNSVPVEVVAAQGAGTVIVPVAASFQYLAGAEPFGSEQELRVIYGVADSPQLTWARMFVKLHRVVSQAFPFPFLPVLADFTNHYEAQAQADTEDQPLSLLSRTFDPGYAGNILTSSIVDGGALYAEDDEITLSNNDGDGVLAVVVVDAVDGGGVVTDYHLTEAGTHYAEGESYAEDSTTSLLGSGFILTVDTITPLSDGTARLTVLYYVMDLLT